MIIKTYPLPASPASKTLTTVQPYDVMGHRDGGNSPQEQPRASEEEESVVADGTPRTVEGGDFISQTKVGTDNEPLQLVDRQFELVIFRHQKGITAKSTDWRGDYPIQADFAENSNTVTAVRVAAREGAALDQHRQGKID